MKRSYVSKALVACMVLTASVNGVPAHAAIADHISRSKVAGVDVVTYRMEVADVVTIEGSLPAGDYFASLNSGNPTIATLTGLMLDKGTPRQDKFVLAKLLDDVGGRLEFEVTDQQLLIHGKILKKDLARWLQILAADLREPAFAPSEFEKARKQLDGILRGQLESVNYLATQRLLVDAFPAGHPNHPVAPPEWLSALNNATLDEVKAFHHKYYGPAHMNLIFTGDVDNGAIRAAVSKSFSGWKGGMDFVRVAPSATQAAVAGVNQDVNLPDKASVTVVAGQGTGLRYTDPDALPLRVGTAVLGSGFTGRLMSAVRVKEGLTYGISASVGGDELVDGWFKIQASFAPALLDKGMSSTRRELEKWQRDGVTQEELAARKTNMIGGFQTSLSTTGGMARAIQLTLQRGEPLTWLDQYPRDIEAVTLQQVNGAIAKYIHPDRVVWVRAGTLP